MNTFPRISVLFSSEKTDDIYSSYKYEDIKPEWIVHQGNLEYLYSETIFKSSLFRKYFIVLACFVNEKKDDIVILYLYPEKTKNPYKYFQLEKNDQMNDRCRRLIEGKTGLFFFELVIHRNDKGEIFGAQSVSERKLWIEKFDEAISRLRSKSITRSISDCHSSRSTFSSFPARSDPINYPSFSADDSNNSLQSNRSLPNNLSAQQSSIESNDTQYLEPIDDYHDIKPIPAEDSDISWEDIFYSNQTNDFANVLNNIGQTGIFLIRPQLQKSASNEHRYTLCAYNEGHIYKFGIHQSPDRRYLLIYRDNEPSFVSIPELCRYYTTHPLHITVKTGLNKYLYLTFPYTHKNLYY